MVGLLDAAPTAHVRSVAQGGFSHQGLCPLIIPAASVPVVYGAYGAKDGSGDLSMDAVF